MDFFEVIKNRHCCRKFDPTRSIDEKLVEKIIEAGKVAPSAGGFYSTRFAIFKGEQKKKLFNIIPERMKWFMEAPLVLVIWSDPKKSINYFKDRAKNFYIIQDAAAAAENIFLSIIALGLSTCWIGTFDDEKLSKILKIKNPQRPMVIMPIGYAA